jgi:hypothetical protein
MPPLERRKSSPGAEMKFQKLELHLRLVKLRAKVAGAVRKVLRLGRPRSPK